jgi:hypothetical protein
MWQKVATFADIRDLMRGTDLIGQKSGTHANQGTALVGQ